MRYRPKPPKSPAERVCPTGLNSVVSDFPVVNIIVWYSPNNISKKVSNTKYGYSHNLFVFS